jgi:MSHA pilin protein MshD
MSRGARRRESGVTLVELVISIAVIGIAVTGTLVVIARTTRASADPMVQRQASAIADAYLEEILAKPFYDPNLGAGGGACPAAVGTRASWDNVCDYNGLDDAGARDQFGAAVAGLSAYRVRVTVDSASATLGGLSGATNVMRADVRVTHSLPIDMVVSGYRANY